jgi:hypothetical protein
MTKGVAENFLVVLTKDERAATRRIVWTSLVTVFLTLFTWLLVDRRLEDAWFGTGLTAFFAAVFVGVAVGALRGRMRYHHRFEESLRFAWNRWMRYSVSAPSAHAIYRQVNGRAPQPSVWKAALALGVVLFASFIVMVVTLLDPSTPLTASSLFVLYGALAGFALADAVVFRHWAHRFRVEVTEMVRRGDLPVWGVV